MDSATHIFVYRSIQMPWLDLPLQVEFTTGIQVLLKSELRNPRLMDDALTNGKRGPHLACILGHARQYSTVSPQVFMTPDLY